MGVVLAILSIISAGGGKQLPFIAPPADPPITVQLWSVGTPEKPSWCGACIVAHRQRDELQKEGWSIEVVDFDKHRAEAGKRKIAAIPCYVIVRGGKEIARSVGVLPKDVLVKWFKRNGVTQTPHTERAPNGR